MCMYLCILIYAHKSQHFVEAHFRHKHETGNWAHTQRTFCDTATLKFHLKMLISTKRRPLYPPLPQIPYPAAYRRLQAEVERPQAGGLHFSLPTFRWQPKLHYVQVVCE